MTEATQLPLKPKSRMTLQGVTKGRIEKSKRIVIYGYEGIGKTTFAAGAPGAIILGAEDGSAHLDVARLPKPENFEDVLEAIRLLTVEEHSYKSLVIDTLDWLEPMIWAYVCKRDEQKDIESYGYGKGYQAAVDSWRYLLAALERMRAAKNMNLVMVAHSWIKPFKNPSGDDYDRHELKLNAKASGLIKEFADAVLFAAWETYAKTDAKTKRVRGVSTGARLIYTERTAAFDAKNRYSLPSELPLSWSDFEAACSAAQVATPAELREEITRKAKQLGGEMEKLILKTTADAKEDAELLARINNRCNAQISKLETNQQGAKQ